jgi:hypothetical protein
MRLITYNFCQLPETNITYSSQDVNFPASNIKHQFRSKQWRSKSTGNYVIDATNNKINFSEGSGEITATITSGTYTSTTLAAEIKTQLDAGGTGDYIVSKSETTGLWTISCNLNFDLLNNTGTNQSVNTLKLCCGFPNSDMGTGSDADHTGSSIALHTEEWVVFDTVTTEEINSVVLLWPKEDGITLSSDAIVTIQANATNTWSSPAVSQTLTIDNTYEVASHYFSTDQSYRYWRVKIVDKANANLYVSVGVVILGKSEAVDNPDNGFTYSLSDGSKQYTTDFGNNYTDVYPTFAQLDIEQSLLEYSAAQVIDVAYRLNGVRLPVFITLDAEGTVFDKDHFAIYGKFAKSYSLQHISYNLFQGKLTLTEIN